MHIDGKNIILTGAASGIGRALLEGLAQYHVQVLAVDQNSPALGAARTQGHMRVFPYSCDLGDPQALPSLFDHALQTLGSVDLFIANAGFAYYEKIEMPDWEHIERIYRVNVFSPLYAAEKMASINRGRTYKVVITASAMGFLGIPGYALYSSTKAALHRFAETYRFELKDRRSLALVYPITTRTSFFSSAAAGRRAPQPWPSQAPEQVAQAILTGIQRDQSAIYPSLFFRIFLRLPFLHLLEQFIEFRRFQSWLHRIT